MIESAKDVYAKDYCDWTKNDFVIEIQYKQRPIFGKDKAIKTSQNLPKLIEIYETTYKGKS